MRWHVSWQRQLVASCRFFCATRDRATAHLLPQRHSDTTATTETQQSIGYLAAHNFGSLIGSLFENLLPPAAAIWHVPVPLNHKGVSLSITLISALWYDLILQIPRRVGCYADRLAGHDSSLQYAWCR